jgi:hypothetical protein
MLKIENFWRKIDYATNHNNHYTNKARTIDFSKKLKISDEKLITHSKKLIV